MTKANTHTHADVPEHGVLGTSKQKLKKAKTAHTLPAATKPYSRMHTIEATKP